jgi:hypothetical protein
MKKIPPGALAALLVTMLLAAPAGAAPANVTVRVEGAAQTLLPRSAVATDATPVLVEGSNSCPGTSAGGALYKAVAGDMGGSWGAFGFLLERVKGETQTAPPSSDPAPFWSFWVNYRFQDQGLCATELQEGDDVLVFADCFSATNKCASLSPLRLEGVPATVTPGQPITVKLEEFTTSFDPNTNTTTTTPKAAEGTTISAGGQTVTTGADGTARLSLPSPGPVSIEATKAGRVRTAALTCVTADPSGLLSVRLSIARKAGGRCWAFDGESERFERHRCGGSRSFRIGDREEWSYLLPRRLPRGRYSIRAVAIDKAGNDSSTVVVIRVR